MAVFGPLTEVQAQIPYYHATREVERKYIRDLVFLWLISCIFIKHQHVYHRFLQVNLSFDSPRGTKMLTEIDYLCYLICVASGLQNSRPSSSMLVKR